MMARLTSRILPESATEAAGPAGTSTFLGRLTASFGERFKTVKAALSASEERAMPPWLLLLAVGMGSLIIVVILGRSLVAHQESHYLGEIRRAAYLTAGGIKSDLEFYARTVEGMALSLRERPNGMLRDQWEQDVAGYFGDFPGLMSMAWIEAGASQQFRWVFPLGGDGRLQSLDLATALLEQPHLFQRPDEDEPWMSRSFDMTPEGKGVFLIVPLGGSAVAGGSLVSLLDIRELVASQAARLAALGLSMRIFDEEELLYPESSSLGNDLPAASRTVRFDVLGRHWALDISPRDPHLLGSDMHFLVGAGILLSLLASIMVYFWQTARLRARSIQSINRLLRTEMAERDAAQTELRHLNETLDRRIHRATERLRQRAVKLRQISRDRRNLQLKYQDLYDNAPDLFCTVDVERRTVTECNQTFLRVLGYEREEVIGRSLAKFYCSESQETVDSGFEIFFRTGKVSNLEHLVRKKDGTVLDASVSVSAVRDEAGRLRFARCVVRDISDLNQLREQLVQSQKMESVGQLAGGIAHDFNNQLFVIKGYCDVLAKRAQDPELLSGPIEEIRKAAQRSAQITGQLLAFSRRQVLQPRVLDLNAELRELEGMLRRLIGEDVALTIVEGGELGSVKVDWGQFQQVVMNLAANARDAMPDGGRLAIETSNVEVDEAYAGSRAGIEPGSYVLLSASDTGCGMDRETLGRIFEPFFTTKGQGVGTGLGLATVHGIIEQSGGHIHVCSEPGRGTTFKIYLPRVNQPEKQADAREAVELPAGSETILLVEDERAVRQLVDQILTGQGYRVLVAEDGKAALERVGEYEGRIDLLITDVVMPGMGGRELVERLAEICREVRVLYMSGYTENAISHHGVLDEGVAFLQKPFSAQGLLEKVRQVLSMPVRSAGQGKRVLVVDDSPTALRLQQVLLAEAGYEVLTAGDGEEAWEVLQKERVDLVMTDVNLPVLGGLGLTERMRSSADFREVPVIVLTGTAIEEERVQFQALNVQAYIQKGTGDDTLMSNLHSLFEG